LVHSLAQVQPAPSIGVPPDKIQTPHRNLAPLGAIDAQQNSGRLIDYGYTSCGPYKERGSQKCGVRLTNHATDGRRHQSNLLRPLSNSFMSATF
jgi:hypothetical protein